LAGCRHIDFAAAILIAQPVMIVTIPGTASFCRVAIPHPLEIAWTKLDGLMSGELVAGIFVVIQQSLSLNFAGAIALRQPAALITVILCLPALIGAKPPTRRFGQGIGINFGCGSGGLGAASQSQKACKKKGGTITHQKTGKQGRKHGSKVPQSFPDDKALSFL